MAIASGTRLGSYEILSRLGAGGMGEVYLANDSRLERKVAIKLLTDEPGRNENRLRRFIQEARAASALNHPNIITIHEIGQTGDGAPFIVTEFIEGETLRARIGNAPLGLLEVLDVAIQICGALSAAHEAGIIHRDIKPENIMLRPGGLVKVLDFGLAKLTERKSSPIDSEAQTVARIDTIPGIVMGTVNYMSPEQARGLAVDARSDVFSLGVVVYEMTTGRRPFCGQTTSDLIAAILTAEPPPLGEKLPDAPPELQRIAGKALRKDREERYQTSKDLLIDLKSLRQELEFAAKQGRITGEAKTYITDEVKTSQAKAETVGRLPLRHALIFLPAAVLIIAAVWWLVAGRNSRTETLSPASLKTVEVVNWASTPGEVYSIGSFSPDAKRIAYSSTESGMKSIWVKQTTSDNRVQITNDDFKNDNPIWSPDGEEVAFFSFRGGQYGIWRKPYLGGTPTQIMQLDDGGFKLRYWSKSNKIYYELNGNLFAVDVNSKQANQITDFDSSKQNISAINIAPDEESIAYVRSDENGGGSLWFMPTQGGSAAQVASDASEIRNTVWHPDGKRILYSANVDGTYQIFMAYTDGRGPAQISFGDKDAFALGVAADGTKILYGSSKEESDVWGVNVANAEEFRVASGINSELWPDVSPDGKTVAFQSVRNLSQGDKISLGSILIKDTSAEGQAFELVANGFLPKWSPDGKQLAFLRPSGDTLNLCSVKATGGEEKQITTGGVSLVEYTVLPYNRYQTSYFSWSPDGSKIVYCSARSGQRNLWVVSADGSNDAQITNNEDANLFLYCPLWSSGGRLVAYTSKANKVGADGKLTYRVLITDTETKEAKVILHSEIFLRLLGWSQDGKALILESFKGKPITGSPTEVSLVLVATATGEQRSIATLQSVYLYNFHLSADGRMIAFASHQDGKDNIWIIPASGGAAKKLTTNNDSGLYFSSLAWSPDGKAIFFGKQSRYSLLSMITNFK